MPTVVTPGNFRIGGGFQDARAKTFSGEIPSGYVLKPDELIITMTDLSKAADTLGSPALVPGDRVYLHNQRIGLVQITRPDRVDTKYLHYRLRLQDYRHHVVATASGTSVRHTSPGRLESFKTELPPLPTQRAIAEILGALDDKIAANARVGSAADGLVRDMFRQFLGLQEVRAIRDLATSVRTVARPPIEANSYVGLEHVPRRLMWLAEHGESVGLASGKFVFAPDDVLFGKLRPYFHKVVVADRAGVCSTDILVLRPKEMHVRGYIWAALSSDALVQRVSAMVEGTRMPRTNWGDLAASQVPWPGDRAAADFSGRVVALRDRVSAATVESRHLATLRDTLLPHLMSGRLTVRDAEARVEAAL
ncbi:MAG: restriction endonuclease subunit S [Propionicimonas sp.]